MQGAAAALAALLFATGCAGFFVYPGSLNGGGTTGGLAGDYVYVANASVNTVAGFAVGTGTLSAVANSPYGLPFSPAAAAVNPANTILFVSGPGYIYAYSIGSGGALTLLNQNLAVGADVVAMDISPDGQWLIGLDGNNVTLDEFAINSTNGALTGPTYIGLSVTGAPSLSVKVAPNGGYVFVALGRAGDLVYTFNTTLGTFGTSPLPLSTGSSLASDNALAVSANSTYLYIARSGTGGGLAVYTISGPNGALASVAGSPFAVGNQPYAVALNSAGTDVYVANRLDSAISGFSIASNGVPAALGGSPYTSGSSVTALAADKSGSYLLAASAGGSPDLTMYSFDSGTAGKLDFATSISTGTDPTGPVAIAATH